MRDPKLLSLKEVLEEVDGVIQVLDVRDPLPYRSEWIENEIKSKGKRIGFILNKIGMGSSPRKTIYSMPTDLAPLEAVTQWRDFLRAEAPTILSRASSKAIASNELPAKGKQKEKDTFAAIGTDALTDLLEHWSSAKKDKEPLKIAFLGMVNVSSNSLVPTQLNNSQSGKSSIINALQTVQVPAYSRLRPGNGFSTTPYPIRVTLEANGKKVELIDTPGLLKQNTDSQSKDIRVRDMLFRNKGKVDKVKDPLPAGKYMRMFTQTLPLSFSSIPYLTMHRS